METLNVFFFYGMVRLHLWVKRCGIIQHLRPDNITNWTKLRERAELTVCGASIDCSVQLKLCPAWSLISFSSHSFCWNIFFSSLKIKIWRNKTALLKKKTVYITFTTLTKEAIFPTCFSNCSFCILASDNWSLTSDRSLSTCCKSQLMVLILLSPSLTSSLNLWKDQKINQTSWCSSNHFSQFHA